MGCIFQSKNDEKDRYKIIIPNSVVMDRMITGNSARLAFKTKQSALCELHVYNQDPKGEPSQEKPLVKPCTGTQTSFVESVSPLDSSSLYTIEIHAWTTQGSKENAEKLAVKENSGKGLGKRACCRKVKPTITHCRASSPYQQRQYSDSKY